MVCEQVPTLARKALPIPETITVSFPARSSPSDLSAFRRDMTRTLEAQKCNLRIDLAAVEVLGSPLIAVLIAILRDARERGLTVLLRTGRRRIVETLRITGLDKVFTVETPDGGAVALQARHYPHHLVA